jgi:hypothetical protein
MTNNHKIYTPVLNILRSWPDSSCFIGKLEPPKPHSSDSRAYSTPVGILLATNNQQKTHRAAYHVRRLTFFIPPTSEVVARTTFKT